MIFFLGKMPVASVLAEFCIIAGKEGQSSNIPCPFYSGGSYSYILFDVNVMVSYHMMQKLATFQVWMDLYTLPVPESGGKTRSQIFEDAGCDKPASPSCGARHSCALE